MDFVWISFFCGIIIGFLIGLIIGIILGIILGVNKNGKTRKKS